MCIFENLKCIAFVVINESNSKNSYGNVSQYELNGKTYYEINRMWVKEDFRGKGLNEVLHLYCIFKLNLHLMTDNDVSPDGKKFYKSFFNKKNNLEILYLNEDTNTITKQQPIDIWDNDNNWRILFGK